MNNPIEKTTLLGPLGTDLARAFWRYEQALVGNDIEVLDELFETGTGTLRAQGGELALGSDAIRVFREGRTPPGPRDLVRVHARELAHDVWLIVAESVRPDGGRGVQSQVWVRTECGWRIRAAHVSTAPAPELTLPQFDARSVWRVQAEPGANLAAPTGTGPLDGLGIAVKDLYEVLGHRVGAGNPEYLAEATPALEHAEAVARLLTAGAHVAGLAQTDELAFSLAGTNVHYGTPPNPKAPDRIPGGSSSGSASAVALGHSAIGLGTDTAGSIRVPASYCGLWGLRTTHGAVPVSGLTGLAPSFDAVGVLTDNPDTLAAATAALLPQQGVAPVRGLLVAPLLDTLAEPATRESVSAARTALALRCDLPVAEIELQPAELESWFAAFRTVQQVEAWQLHGAFAQRHGASLAPQVLARFEAGRDTSPETLVQAQTVLDQARSYLHALLAEGWVLALPSTSGPAPAVSATAADVADTRAATLRLTCLASLAGLPALGAPLGLVEGLPVGLCLLGATGTDRGLTALFAADGNAPLSPTPPRL